MSPGPVAMPGAPHPLPAGAQLRPVQNTGSSSQAAASRSWGLSQGLSHPLFQEAGGV